jgi:hypothetical protein
MTGGDGSVDLLPQAFLPYGASSHQSEPANGEHRFRLALLGFT